MNYLSNPLINVFWFREVVERNFQIKLISSRWCVLIKLITGSIK